MTLTMGVIWVFHMLLVFIKCSKYVFAISYYRECGMEEEKTTEETFGRKLQQTFKSTHHTGLVSTVLCFQDVRCTGVFVCPGICHMFGVFRIPQSSVLKADYRSCKVFNIVSNTFVTFSTQFYTYDVMIMTSQ